MRVRGSCYVILAHDVGFAIDLVKAESALRAELQGLQFKNPRRVPEAARLRTPPLRMVQAGGSVAVGEHRTDEAVTLMLHEFGGASVVYRIPIAGELESLVAMSDLLWDNAALIEDARRRMERLVEAIGSAVHRPAILGVEDYVVFGVEIVDGTPVEALWTTEAETAARILRAEPGKLSEQEIAEAISLRCAYDPGEMGLIDWYAALLVGDDMDDERYVLEFAAVELLELRLLDAQLDRDIDAAYDLFTQRRSWWRSLRSLTDASRRVSQLAADRAVLFEGIDNGLKLLGDQYLARVYRAASERFHLPQWDQSIERKLAVLGSIYAKLDSQASGRRFELLEVIIIVLIAVSTVAPLLPALTK
jgi:hypothetical protein